MLSIAPGYDPRYLTRQVGQGAENYYLSAVHEHGEPPGIWWGRGADELGLTPGSEVEAAVMEELYSTFADPRDPDFLNQEIPDEDKARLGRRPPQFQRSADEALAKRMEAEPDADPERQAQLRREVLGQTRQAVMHHDATFSPTKSVSLLHAGLQASALQARQAGRVEAAERYEAAAGAVWNAVDAGAAASLSYLQEHAGYARRGSHSQVIDGRSTGKWIEAGGWVAARFRQHTNREGEPQLHVHQAILNRQLGADGRWSGLDGRALYRVRPAAAAYGERVMYERLVKELGVELVARPDGNGFEIKGVTPEQIAAFSTRRTQVTEDLRQRIADYTAAHGYEPSARAVFRMAQDATLNTKAGKPKLKDAPTRAEELAAWEERTTEREIGLLSQIPAATIGRFHGDVADKAIAEAANIDYQRVLTAAVADAQAQTSTFSRYEVTRMIARHLPAYLGGLPEERVEAFLEELTDAALDPAGPAAVRLLSSPDVVDMPARLQRSDGTSVYQAPTSERYTTADQLDVEADLLRSATATGGPRVHSLDALQALEGRVSPDMWAALQSRALADPTRSGTEHSTGGSLDGEASPEQTATTAPTGTAPEAADRTGGPASASGAEGARSATERTLLDDQAAAIYGILTSGRRTDALVGYAGTGKSYTVSTLADIWRERTGAPVVGLTVAQNAAYVLAGEGMDDAWNISRWLEHYDRGQVTVQPEQLAVVDEAGMVPTAQLRRIQEIFADAGGKLVLSGDPSQLAAPATGGAMRHLVDTAGAYELSTVLRFRQEWEREASVQLRAGAADVLGEYDAHGRLQQGSQEEMETAARHAYLADYLDGRQSLLLASTNEQAADLARQVRTELSTLGLVSGPEVPLRDGNAAAPGDLIVARENDQKVAIGDTERQLSNRDVLRVEAVENGAIKARLVDQNGVPSEHLVDLTPSYVTSHVELAYASTVHAAQGRTVHRSYSLVSDDATRNMFYVMMTRGRDGNYAFVVSDAGRVADLRPGPDQAAPLGGEAASLDDGADGVRPGGRDMFAVLRGVLERAEDSETALEAMRAEAQRPTHMGHLGAMWAGVSRDHTADAYIDAAEKRGALSSSEAASLRSDEAKEPLGRLLRQIEMSGRNVEQILDLAAAERELGSAESLGQVLHWRITEAARERGISVTALEPSEEQIGGSWLQRTPKTGDAEIDRLLGQLATEMEVRTHRLGEQAAQEPPAWLAERMGTPPAEDVTALDQWSARAGAVMAYREMYGVADDVEVLGAEPSKQQPEQRAAWYAAYDALHGVRPGQTATASLGELWSARARYERQLAWAPPHVADQLRAAEIQARQYGEEAVRLRAQAEAADDDQARTVLQTRAHGQQTLAEALAARVAALREVHEARKQWHQNTEADRVAAMRADAQLRRRDDVDEARLSRLHTAEPDIETTLDQEATRTRQAEQIPGQLTIDGWGDVPTQPANTAAQPTEATQEPAATMAEETMYERYAMRRRADLPPPSPGTVAETLGLDLGEVEAHMQQWAARFEQEQAQPRPEPTRPAEPAHAATIDQQADVAEETAVPQQVEGQLSLDLFGLGDQAPDDPELASAVEQARAARQALEARAEQADVTQAGQQTEEERIRRQPERSGPANAATIERHHEATEQARQELEVREEHRQAFEAARLASLSFPSPPQAQPRPQQAPSMPPPKPSGPRIDGPSLG